MKLEYISKNLTTILREVMKNQDIMDLLVGQKPSDDKTVEEQFPKAPINHTLFPTIFNPKTVTSETCTLHVYFPEIDFVRAGTTQETTVVFDIVCDKNLWVMDGGLIRPMEILKHLYNAFDKKEVYEVGQLSFQRSRQHATTNENYDLLNTESLMYMWA